ncbi:transcriptional regulator [Propioniciclava flava]|jgi:ArsR family transcriptional regulator|uniref:Transcriptional regulator n=1 Tax=Propioniciclava flava TaxID=2072026 RepID=A0A4Q2EDH9_9ACTN|nr:transcriptional regulator [Propioniciclava flava]
MRVALLAQAAAREHSSGVVESIEAELTRDAATLLAVAADPVRLTLLNRLAASGTRCVCDLQLDPPIPANLLSYHLRMLREAGLVTTARRGRWVDYTLAEDALERLHAALPVAAATRAECGSCR